MKFWMWLVPSLVLGVATAALEAGGSPARKAEFTNKCVGTITDHFGAPAAADKVCSCILDRGLEFKQQHPGDTPSKSDHGDYLKQCSAENGFDLRENRHNPWLATADELHQVIGKFADHDPAALQAQLDARTTFEQFLAAAPALNPARESILDKPTTGLHRRLAQTVRSVATAGRSGQQRGGDRTQPRRDQDRRLDSGPWARGRGEMW